jgi:hypothetical protein
MSPSEHESETSEQTGKPERPVMPGEKLESESQTILDQTDESERIVMVSVLYVAKDLISYLIDRGFKRLERLPSHLRVELEITGGYFSLMRGDRGAKGSAASVFHVSPNYLSFLQVEQVVCRETTFVAIGPYPSQTSSISGGTNSVLYIIGPASSVRSTIENELLRLPESVLHATLTDLEITLYWWGSGEVREV